jgi:DNA-binding MarR family transcriptional regulator
VSATAPALDVETAARLRAVIGRASRRLRLTASDVTGGLTPTRVSVLQHVARSGPLRLSELATSEGLNPTMLSRVVADLADAGLLERVSDQGDRRAAWAKATPAGKRLADRIRREKTDALYLALAALPDVDLALIERALPALERVAEQLRERTG